MDIIYVRSLVVFLHIERSDDKEWIWEIRAKHQDLFAKVEFDSDDTGDDSDDTDDDSDDSDAFIFEKKDNRYLYKNSTSKRAFNFIFQTSNWSKRFCLKKIHLFPA